MATPDRPRWRRPEWAFVAFWSLVSLGVILYLAPSKNPVQTGSSERFWYYACDVLLDPSLDETGLLAFSYAVVTKDGEYGCLRHSCGSEVWSVPVEDAMQDFDRVLAELSEASRRGDDSHYVKGYEGWRELPPVEQSADMLLREIERAKVARYRDTHPAFADRIEGETLENTYLFLQYRQQEKCFWAVIVFEWVLFTGLVYLACRPYFKSLGPASWGIHAAALPVLVMLPFFLGYAADTFRAAAPDGGILYPELLRLFDFDSINAIDRVILDHTPKPLSGLTSPFGPPLSLSGRTWPGPTLTALVGILFGGAIFFARFGYIRGVESREPEPVIFD